MHVGRINMELYILYLRGCQSKFLYNDVFLSLKITVNSEEIFARILFSRIALKDIFTKFYI